MSEFTTAEMARPGVLRITLERPRKRNALSVALLVEVAAHLTRAEAGDEVRCAVLTGDERAFSAGADIAEMVDDGFATIESPARKAAWAVIEDFPKPLVAAAAGYAFGGGNELAMLADIMIAGTSARFGQPEISIGVIPGDGGTQRLTRAVGKSLAMKMILTGEPIDAATAFAAGLVAEVVADDMVLARALDIAETIAAKAPVAARLAKKAVLAAYETPLHSGLAVERQAVAAAFQTEDRTEGMAAFLEKRPPRFAGR